MKYIITNVLLLSLFGFFLLNSNVTLAEGTDSETEFKNAIELFNQKKYAESGAILEALVKIHPDDSTVLFNRGVVAYYEGKLGLALAGFRKSMKHKIFSSEERQYISKIEPMLQKGNLSFPSPLNTFPFYYLTTDFYLILSLILFVLSSWYWLNYLGLRRNTSEDLEVPTPWRPIVLSTFFILIVGVSAFKFIETQKNYSTVLTNNTALKTQISDDSPTISELPEGLEVLVLQNHESWAQVSHPNYSVGWVKSESLL